MKCAQLRWCHSVCDLHSGIESVGVGTFLGVLPSLDRENLLEHTLVIGQASTFVFRFFYDIMHCCFKTQLAPFRQIFPGHLVGMIGDFLLISE